MEYKISEEELEHFVIGVNFVTLIQKKREYNTKSDTLK